MKYWFYSEGNILGPYAPGELLTTPGFAQDSLVCLETCAGDNPGDWKAAYQVDEISAALSVGAGKMTSSGYGSGGDSYAFDSGALPAVQPAYENYPDQGSSYESLLNTIEGILKTGNAAPNSASEREKSLDYDFMDKFDIRLSKIQEELEAARWEKNLLLEKMRMKEIEDKKQCERIAELENKLKAAIGRISAPEQEFERLPRPAELKGKAEPIKKIGEINKDNLHKVPPLPAPETEELQDTVYKPQDIGQKAPDFTEAEGSPVAESESVIEEKDANILKNLEISGEIKLERHGVRDMSSREGTGITSGKLKSLGGSAKKPADFGPGHPEPAQNPPAIESEKVISPLYASPSPAVQEPVQPVKLEPLPQQAGGVVYDFTVVTSRGAEPVEKMQQFEIETVVPRGAAPSGGFSGAETTQRVTPRQPHSAVETPAVDNSSGPEVRQAQESFQAPASKPGSGQPQPSYQIFGAPAGNANHLSQFSTSGGADRSESQPQFQSALQAADNLQRGGQTAEPHQEAGLKNSADRFGASAELQERQADLSGIGSAKPPSYSSELEKTERVTIPTVKIQAEEQIAAKPASKGGRMAFMIILTIFGAIAAGGLGFFFLGDGLSLSEFSMLDFNSSKRSTKSIMPSQLESQAKETTDAKPAADNASKRDQGNAAVESQSRTATTPVAGVGDKPVSQNQPSAQAPDRTAAPLVANEGVKKAIEIVKNYKLSGGRGAIGGWFANSFLSGSSGGASEVWTATPLHGDILVVQYRLIRQKYDPLLYQFEVDVSKNEIIRGLNNDAMELLDFSQEKTVRKEGRGGQAGGALTTPQPEPAVKKASARKLSAKAKPARKPGRLLEIPMLELPDAPKAVTKEEDPTGFENDQSEGGEKVRYIKAQESDEELF
ncbi:MAG TPA: hypothetical protein DCL44_09250 [Elusimicrobia bacterium]|nr:hypothetical protein [Elusimicrobiota bacterium]